MAVADYAEGRGPQPQELAWAFQARAYHVLPKAGGLEDQSAGVLARMSAAENVYRSVKGWKTAHNWADWARSNPDDWRIVQDVLKLRGA